MPNLSARTGNPPTAAAALSSALRDFLPMVVQGKCGLPHCQESLSVTIQHGGVEAPTMWKSLTLGQKIRSAREKAGLTQTQLGDAVGVTRAAVSQWESDSNGPTLQTMLRICSVLGLTPDGLNPIQLRSEPLSAGLAVKGEVRAGAWLELDGEPQDHGTIPATPDSRFLHVPQYALKVVGTSMNKIASQGQYVIVASWAELGQELRDGDLVVVQRNRVTTQEVTMKRARRGASGWELWPESTDPRWQEPVFLDDGGPETEVTVIGKVIGRYEPL